MTEDIQSWRASLREYRTFLGLSFACMLLILVTSIKPGLFTISTPVRTTAIESPAPSKPEPPVDTAVETEPEPTPAPFETAQAPAAVESIRPVEPIKPVRPVKPITPTVEHRPTPKPASKPAPAPQPKPAVSSSRVSPGYYVQLGAFSELPRAQGLADQLAAKGWHSAIVPKGRMHAVWAGPAATRTEAESTLKAIRNKLKLTGFIVHRAQ